MTRTPRRPSVAARFLASQSRLLGRKASGKRPIVLMRDPTSGVEVTKHSNDGPTPEHRQHAKFKRTLIYERKPGNEVAQTRIVMRKIDVVANLLAAGKLDDPTKSTDWNDIRRELVRKVADRFHKDFWRSGLSNVDPLKAIDFIFMPSAPGPPGGRIPDLDAVRGAGKRVTLALRRCVRGYPPYDRRRYLVAMAALCVLGLEESLLAFAKRMKGWRDISLAKRRKNAENLVILALKGLAS